MKKLTILIISLVLLAPLMFSYDNGSEPDPGSYEPRYYDNAKVMRVKYTQGEAFVKRSYDEGLEEAAINLPVFEKDVAGTTDGRLEIYMGRLNYVRLDYETEVVFDKVPELRKTELSVRILHGGVYLDIENLDYERDIEIQTPDCGVFLLDKGQYRINVNEGGRTEVFVYDGVAEVAGDNYSRNVRGNQKIVMFNGRVKERPFYFYSMNKDDFDRWNQDRGRVIGYARYSSSSYLDDGYGEYEYELSRHGRWRYDSTYGRNIWIPYNVDSNWRPYYNGRWVYNPYYGYTWMSFDSWGYFTHHYGRWHWSPTFHWYWVPGYRWSPAWVSWFWDDYHYGWCPISWWNRPVIVINGHWRRNYHFRNGIPRRAYSTTIIRKSQLAAPRVSRVALARGELSKMSKKSFVFKGNAPNVKPRFEKVNVINARGKAVVYNKSGLVSKSKYKVVKGSVDLKKLKETHAPVYKYSGAKVSKDKVSRYSKSGYSSRATFKAKSSKYEPSNTSKSYKYGSSNYSGKKTSPAKLKKYSSTSRSKSSYKYRSGSSSGSRSSSSVKIKKSSSKSSSSRKSSGSKSSKIKKKKESPYYSYSSSGDSSSESYYSSSPYSSRKYSSKKYYPSRKPTVKSSSRYSSKSSRSTQKSYSSSGKSYKPSSSSKYYSSPSSTSRSSYKSYGSSNRSSYKRPTKSYSSSSSRNSSSSSSYRRYSSPRSSSYKSSSSSYSRPSSSSSYRSKSYSKPSSTRSRSSSSYRSSSRSSSSRSSKSYSRSSSRSSSSRSRSSSSRSSSSSSRSFKKKD